MTPRQIHTTAKMRRKIKDMTARYGRKPFEPLPIADRLHFRMHGFHPDRKYS